MTFNILLPKITCSLAQFFNSWIGPCSTSVWDP